MYLGKLECPHNFVCSQNFSSFEDVIALDFACGICAVVAGADICCVQII